MSDEHRPTEHPRVQRVDVYPDGQLVLELFTPGAGKSSLGFIPGVRGLNQDAPRPDRDGGAPPAVQKVFRQELKPALLVERERPEPHLEVLTFTQRGGKGRKLFVEFLGADARAVLTASKDKGERVLAVVGQKRPRDGRDLRKGRLYTPPDAPTETPLDALATMPRAAAAPAAPSDDATELRAYGQRLRTERKRLSRLRRAIEGDLKKHGDPDALAACGEALKSTLHTVTRGDEEAVGTGPDGQPMRVALDTRRSPADNLEHYFRRAKRAREGRRRAQPRLDDVDAQLREVERARQQLDALPYLEDVLRADIDAILSKRSAGNVRARAPRHHGPRRAWRTFRGHGDVLIKVGRSAKDNDALTFREARGKDTWLHARGAPGSHVIIPVPRDAIPEALLVDAAHLAAWFSPQRKEARVDVQYTDKKHVKKPGRNAAPGAVHLSKERVIHLVVDPERTQALLAREVEG